MSEQIEHREGCRGPEIVPSGGLVCPEHYLPVQGNGRGCYSCAIEITQERNRGKKEQP